MRLLRGEVVSIDIQSFRALLIAFSIFNPASGAFVSLSQATLMDLDPARYEQMMARWTLARSLGGVAGPLVVAAALSLRLGWRPLYAALAALTLALVWLVRRQPAHNGRHVDVSGLRAGVRQAFHALGNREVWRRLYSSMPGQSGTTMAIGPVMGIVGGLIP